MVVAIAAGQARDDILDPELGQDGDAIIGLLSVYGAIIAQRLERFGGKRVVGAFEFLEADKIRLGRLQPRDSGLQPRAFPPN